MKGMLFRLLPLVLIVGLAYFVWQGPEQDTSQAVMPTLACADLQEGCRIELGGRAVTVMLQGELKPLQPFQVQVLAPGAHKVEARFRMQDMDMGFNLYNLRADAAGVFQAQVTLPACVSGRRDWIMDLSVDGTSLAVPFVTDL